MVKLTNETVRTLPVKGTDTLYADSETPGLYLRVRAGGSRSFIIQWRQGQFQRRSTVGKVGILSVDEARKKARKLLVGIDDGHDPVAAKAKARVDDKQLFGVLVDEYLPVRAKDMKPRSLEQTTLHLRKYWKPLHKLPLKKIDRATVAAELRTIIKERGPVAADRGRSTLSAFFGWAIGEGSSRSIRWSAPTRPARTRAGSACFLMPSLSRSGTLRQPRTMAGSSSC